MGNLVDFFANACVITDSVRSTTGSHKLLLLCRSDRLGLFVSARLVESALSYGSAPFHMGNLCAINT